MATFEDRQRQGRLQRALPVTAKRGDRSPKPYKGFPSKAAYRRARKKVERLDAKARHEALRQLHFENEGPEPRTEFSEAEFKWMAGVVSKWRKRRAAAQ